MQGQTKCKYNSNQFGMCKDKQGGVCKGNSGRGVQRHISRGYKMQLYGDVQGQFRWGVRAIGLRCKGQTRRRCARVKKEGNMQGQSRGDLKSPVIERVH